MTSRRPYWCPKTMPAAMLVSQTSPVGVELFSYANALFCSNKFAYMLATWVKTLYRAGNIYVISTARDNTKIFAWSTLLFVFRESPLGEFFFEVSWPRAARLRAWCCFFFIIYVQHLHNLREEEKLRNSGYMAWSNNYQIWTRTDKEESLVGDRIS